MKGESKNISRRRFLGTTLAGTAGLLILPGFKAIKPSDTINLGFIGLGQQAMFLLNSFLNIDGVRVVAGCDVYGIKRKRFEQRVKAHYEKQGKNPDVFLCERYEDLLARPDVDAVVIATPDHWHALIAIDACKAGKDVYLEKPLTFTILEGKMLVRAVRENNRILAVGSQQRSDPNFQHAVRLVQEGKLGAIKEVIVHVGDHPKPYDLPEEPLPDDLNWDLWLGPNPWVHYNHELNPPISLDPPKDEQLWGAWRWYKETGGGFITDWGAHMFDIAQWGLGMDQSGPVEIIPAGYQDTKVLTYRYANGVMMTQQPFDKNGTKGVKFVGSEEWIEVARGYFRASSRKLKPRVSKEKGPYETKISHQQNFIDAIRSRKDPVVPVEIGHRTCTVCNLGNIAHELQRPVRWNPSNEMFVNDQEAEKYMHRQYREGYRLV